MCAVKKLKNRYFILSIKNIEDLEIGIMYSNIMGVEDLANIILYSHHNRM